LQRASEASPCTYCPLSTLRDTVEAVIFAHIDGEAVPEFYARLSASVLESSSLLAALPASVIIARPDGRLDFWNRNFAQYIGVATVPSLITLTEALLPQDRERFLRHWRRRVASAKPFDLEVLLRRYDGCFRWQQLSARPLMNDAVVIKWIVSITDVHDHVESRDRARSSARRLQFLAETSSKLLESMEPSDLARTVCRCATRWLARRAALRFEVDGMCGSAAYPEECIDGLDDGSRLEIPILAGEKRFGTLTLWFVEGAAPSFEDLELFEELARRLALKFENLRLYLGEQRIAAGLQRRLMPERLAQPDGVHVDATYLPASEELIVGGDWYDCFELYDGRLAVTVGDVGGHGLAAAALMGSLRQSLRAALLDGLGPSHALMLANHIVYTSEPEIATAFAVVVDTVEMTMCYANAGHPPPLLVENGRLRSLSVHDPVLGVKEEIVIHEETVAIPPGGAMVGYTDGFVEQRRNLIEGMSNLEQAVLRWAEGGMRAGADDLAQTILGRDERRDDDAAMLLVRFEPTRDVNITLAAVPSQSQRGRRALQRFARESGIARPRADDFVLASCEALNNAIEHAYRSRPGNIRLQARKSDDSVVVTVFDEGSWKEEPPDADRGRGLTIMHALSDGVDIRCDERGTAVRLHFAAMGNNANSERYPQTADVAG
jgi:serine phosphatase RsbU (regulator of sigma subunit)/anti-sigma regulatory factor (Ser/Thr protein kinase)